VNRLLGDLEMTGFLKLYFCKNVFALLVKPRKQKAAEYLCFRATKYLGVIRPKKD
jgi:hypothetical protein